MDVPEKKAGSMDPVTVAKKTPRPIDVRAWALFTFCVTAFSLAVGYSITYSHALDHFHVPCWQAKLNLYNELKAHQEGIMKQVEAMNAKFYGKIYRMLNDNKFACNKDVMHASMSTMEIRDKNALKYKFPICNSIKHNIWMVFKGVIEHIKLQGFVGTTKVMLAATAGH